MMVSPALFVLKRWPKGGLNAHAFGKMAVTIHRLNEDT